MNDMQYTQLKSASSIAQRGYLKLLRVLQTVLTMGYAVIRLSVIISARTVYVVSHMMGLLVWTVLVKCSKLVLYGIKKFLTLLADMWLPSTPMHTPVDYRRDDWILNKEALGMAINKTTI